MAKQTFRYTTRRQFIGASALATFGFTYLPSRVWGANERLQFAGIGVGGKGSSDIDGAGNLGEVVALCDVDDNTLNAKATNIFVPFAPASRFHGRH